MMTAVFQQLLPHCLLARVPPGEVVEEVVNHLYYVLEGVVALEQCSPDDDNPQSTVVMYHHRGDVLAPFAYTARKAGLADLKHHENRWYKTETECFLASISYVMLDKVLCGSLSHAKTDIEQALLLAHSEQLEAAYRRIAHLCESSIMLKLRKCLEYLAETHGSLDHNNSVFLGWHKRERIADLMGCSRESVSRYLQILEEKGVVWLEGRKLWLLKPSKATLNSLNGG